MFALKGAVSRCAIFIYPNDIVVAVTPSVEGRIVTGVIENTVA